MTRLPFAFKKGPRTARAPRKTPEADFQRSACTYLDWALPEPYTYYASAVGVNLGRFKGGKMKAMGVRADWADLTIVNLDTGGCRWLEMKSATGSLSAGQRRLAARLGAKWVTCRTLSAVEAALISWGIKPLRPVQYADRYSAHIGVEPL